jgi:hypothetical protein
MRSILTDLDREQALPPGLLLIGGRPQLLEHTFVQLKSEMAAVVTQLRHTAVSKR